MPQDNVIAADFVQPEQPQNVDPHAEINYAISVLAKVRKVLNVTVLLFLAMLGALAIFGYATYDPTASRIVSATLYAISVLLPSMYLYLRKA